VQPFKFKITNFGKSVTQHGLLTNKKMESAANKVVVGQMKTLHSMKTFLSIRLHSLTTQIAAVSVFTTTRGAVHRYEKNCCKLHVIHASGS
jgi:hypothetical protein